MPRLPVAPFAHHVPGLDDIVAAQAALRRRGPLVQCLTNVVSSNFMANALLAVGAAPAMVDNPEEAALFAAVADAVLINLGTPTAARVESMRQAAEAAQGAGRPWVLDPVGAGALPWRRQMARDLLRYRPAAIRGNGSEIIGLAGLGAAGKGVDSAADPAAAVPAALELLAEALTVSASGPIDHIVGRVGPQSEVVLIRVAGGSALLPRVTATGCVLGALTAAYAAVAPDPLTGLVAAHTHVAVAAELAAATASRPGSFAVAFIDALDQVDEAALRERAQIMVTDR